MTSQVSSTAEQADGAVVAEQRPPLPGAGQDGASGPSPEGGQQAEAKEVRKLDRVIIRFAGDSGDGMQLTGDRFTSETASFGN
ncbi:2-oxoglutarate ferredoxin oxidoreductase subunit alpha, partial [Streptomyces albidoflavus]